MKKDRHEYYRGKKGKKYGIYNTAAKCFQFGISEDTPMLAEARLFQLIGDDARKWRFEPRALPPDGKTVQHVIIDEVPREELLYKAAAYIRKVAHDAPPQTVEITARHLAQMEELAYLAEQEAARDTLKRLMESHEKWKAAHPRKDKEATK